MTKERLVVTIKQGGNTNMASKRTLKREIKQTCMDIFAECVAASLYGSLTEKASAEALMHTLIRIEEDFISRMSHQEPGLPAKAYFNDLISKFNEQISEIIDQIKVSE